MTDAAGLPGPDTTITFTCGCTYIRTSQLMTETTPMNTQTDILADDSCLVCDMMARVEANLKPATPDDGVKSAGFTTYASSLNGKTERAQSLTTITDLDQISDRETPGLYIHPAIEAGLMFADDVAELAAQLRHDLEQMPQGGAAAYLVADEIARERFIDGPISDDEYEAWVRNDRIPADRCHCPACIAEDEIPPKDMSDPAPCDGQLSVHNFTQDTGDNASTIDGYISPLGSEGLDDGFFVEALALLDDSSDSTATIRWTTTGTDSSSSLLQINSAANSSSIKARNSLSLPCYDWHNTRQASVYGEQSFDLPVQRPESPFTPIILRSVPVGQPRIVSVVSGAYQEMLLQPYRIDVACEDGNSIYPVKGARCHCIFRRRQLNTTKKSLLQRMKSKMMRKFEAVKKSLSSCPACAHMQG